MKLRCRNLSSTYDLSKLSVSRVIRRKTEYMGAFDQNATSDRKDRTAMHKWSG